MTIATGTRFDRYEILSPLGKGGMGEVYLALDTRLKRKVALKLLPAAFTADADRVRRFEQEAQAASALNHPNIITIHEIGEADGAHFIATEFIEGQTLRQQLTRGRMELSTALDVALQAASALAAAHVAGIIHRDIKPENIMLRPDGLVKVLDFGLVKLTERQEAVPDSEAPTSAGHDTDPGTVMGTAQYMSPEQARGEKVDGRTDIFSLGVILYEMLAGSNPFAGAAVAEVFAAILKTEAKPLAHYRPEVPSELEHIVAKALRKDREERYQSVKDLLIDLKDLKHRLEFEAELERTVQPRHQAVQSSGRSALETAQAEAAATGEDVAVPTISSAKILLGEIKRHKLGVGLALAVIVMAAVAAFFWLNRKPILTDKDTIMLTEFDNKTGDAVFDSTLRQGLAVQLQQSPFLDLFPDQRIRATLRLMSRSPDERVTRELGLGICQRQGLKAFITGTIAKFDRNYSLTLEALNGQTGDSLALVQVEAEGKDQVLKALSRAASELRRKLGESLSSIQKFDAPLEVTTSSLDALKEFALGRDEGNKGQFLKAIPFYQRALEKDPSFAVAWLALAVQYNNTNQPELAAESTAKAFALRDRVSEDERARITQFYYSIVIGELDKAVEAQESYWRNYPRDTRGPGNLSDLYGRTGQYEKAVAAAREAMRLNPNSAPWHINLADSLMRLNRFAEAEEVLQRALAQKLDNIYLHGLLYAIAFAGGNAEAMREQIAWASGKPDEHIAVDWQAQTAAFAGEWRKSQDYARRATEMAERNEAKEVAAQYTAQAALRAAALGQAAQAGALAEAALKIERNKIALARAALALALVGEAAKAQSLVQELEKQYPKDTLVNQLWLPEIKAALELRKGNAQSALDLLEPVKRYEAADEFRPQTVRGEAYLKHGKGAEAAVEFQKILAHRGEAPLSVLYPLAHLGLARAAVLQGDAPKARQKYQDFFALWKEADADLPILIEAKKEYEKMK
jgi:tetratricopeptide (TPR) repeat protein